MLTLLESETESESESEADSKKPLTDGVRGSAY